MVRAVPRTICTAGMDTNRY